MRMSVLEPTFPCYSKGRQKMSIHWLPRIPAMIAMAAMAVAISALTAPRAGAAEAKTYSKEEIEALKKDFEASTETLERWTEMAANEDSPITADQWEAETAEKWDTLYVGPDPATLTAGETEKPAADAIHHVTDAVKLVPYSMLTSEQKDYFIENDVPGYGESNQLSAFAIDNLLLFLAAVLVILMQPGFALLEAGLNAAKNTVNILFKNIMDLAVGVLLFFLIGYGLMYPGGFFFPAAAEGADYNYGVLGFGQVGIGGYEKEPAAGALTPQVDFLFQVAFAATAATIVSGAVAGRMRFLSYLIYSAVLTGLIYPISGSWKWGGGFLQDLGFHDFAGSCVVHAVGGFAGLAGAIVLGPRIGRFAKGKSYPMPGHNLGFATLGVFLLWVGWYGFNPGSQLAIHGKLNTELVMKIAVNTTLAAAAGAVVAMFVSWLAFKKPDLTMALNGALAGLVGITANCDCVINEFALVIGAVAGVLVVIGIVVLDKLRIDDPVGAWPVHGLCGVWGCLAVPLFGVFDAETMASSAFTYGSLVPQVVGCLLIPIWAFGTMFGLFYALKTAGILRVPPEDEQEGLDYSEHGMHAYPASWVAENYTRGPRSHEMAGA